MDFKQIFVAIILCFGILTPSTSQADLNATMEEMFSSMINITAPNAHLSARRGIIDGGSLVLRNRVTNIQLVSFNPPKFATGCGGIDAFMGSFSFINSDQFVNALRAIASNAISYAFQLALAEMCPSCNELIGKLRAAAAKINEWGGNTCKTAQWAVDNTIGKKAPGTLGKNLVASWLNPIAKGVGVVVDGFNSNFPTPGQPIGGNSLTPAQRYAANLDGNIAYRILTEGGIASASSWIIGNDNALIEELISLTGTVIIKPPPTSDPDGPEKPPVVDHLPPLLDFKVFVGGFETSREQDTLKLYQCASGVSDCMEMIPTDSTSLVPMVERVRNILIGTSGTSGIINKYALNLPIAFTNEELSFMSVLPDVAKNIRDLARVSPGSARVYARAVAAEAGFMLAERVVDELFTTLDLASAKKEHHAALSTYLQKLTEVRKQITADKVVLYTKISSRGENTALYKTLLETNKVILRLNAGALKQGASSKH